MLKSKRDIQEKAAFFLRKKKYSSSILEHTPWWRSKEAFDFLNMKARNKLNQQAIIQPSA